MGQLLLFHGTPNKTVVPTFGLGNDKHDYGRGFYLTESPELAKEWAVCRPNDNNGWLHKYKLDTDGLKILDFQEKNVLCWLAELMKHRDAADTKRYRMLAQKFIEKSSKRVIIPAKQSISPHFLRIATPVYYLFTTED